MPLQATSGAASYDAFGGGVPVVPNYIEDVFSSYLWTGNDATQTITNGIDLAGKGGLVWMKGRSEVGNHYLATTNGGNTSYLNSDTTNAYQTSVTRITSFNANGFSLGGSGSVNGAGATYVSWTFRKQPKFFDVVTYTGTFSNLAVNHNLGSVPGCIIVKSVTGPSIWSVYHRSLGATKYLRLNQTTGETTSSTPWNNTAPTSTQFTVGSDYDTNDSDVTYIAYLFAHDAGGFGLTGTDNVISCGSFTTDGSANATVTLGYEPQWVMIKSSSNTGNWFVIDNMRNFSRTVTASLSPNLSNAEAAGFGDATYSFFPTATGFQSVQDLAASQTYIYIAIRRGPMKVPTSGTSVFSPVAYTGDGANNRAITTGFVSDMVWWKGRSNGTDWKDATLLIGTGRALSQNTTDAEGAVAGYYINTYNNTGFTYGTSDASYNTNTWTYVVEGFKRAPSFMDVVCYTGTGSARTINHNLGVAPEMMIIKRRDGVANWEVYHKDLNALGTETPDDSRINLNNTNAATANNVIWNSTLPTSTVFSVGASSDSNRNGNTFVNYLFSTCAGVSKCFSYTGNGSSQTINCGFTGGARFVLIKRTDDSGDWYVWDSARGIVSGNDPHLSLNSTDAEVTTDDTIDTDSTGFVVNQVSATNVNVSSATYIGLAIA